MLFIFYVSLLLRPESKLRSKVRDILFVRLSDSTHGCMVVKFVFYFFAWSFCCRCRVRRSSSSNPSHTIPAFDSFLKCASSFTQWAVLSQKKNKPVSETAVVPTLVTSKPTTTSKKQKSPGQEMSEFPQRNHHRCGGAAIEFQREG